MLKVTEKFYSIQGESFTAGLPAVFVRFQGCCNSCPYCDSKQASMCNEPTKYMMRNKDEVIAFANKVATPPSNEVPAQTVIITGGEPFIEKNLDLLPYFVSTLLGHGLDVHFETTMMASPNDIVDSNILNTFNYIQCKLDQYGDLPRDQMGFMVCPKLDNHCYTKNVTIDQIINFYSYKHIDPKYFETEAEVLLDEFVAWCKYKVVYYPEIEQNILRFVDEWAEYRDIISIMPFTPIGDNFSQESWTDSKLKTIDFCKKYALRFSPRLHIDLWGLKPGV